MLRFLDNLNLKNKKAKSFFIDHFVRVVPAVLLGYLLLFLVTQLFFRIVIDPQSIKVLSTQDALRIMPVFLLSAGVLFGSSIYVFNSWLARKWLKLSLSRAILFAGAMGAMGPIGEIVVNSISIHLLGQPLWRYTLLPVHGGATSMVMSVLWPLYGFHLYCFHTALKSRYRITEESDLSFFIGVDAITLEVLVNLFSLSFFYTYIFYYLAGDLWHVSTAVIFIPYVLCGYFIVYTLHSLEKTHHRIIAGLAGFALGWTVIFLIP